MARIPQKWIPVLRKECAILDVRDLKRVSTSKTWSGLSSNDGIGFVWEPLESERSNPLPARSDGLDNVDGGPDAAFYIQMRVIEQVSIWGCF